MTHQEWQVRVGWTERRWVIESDKRWVASWNARPFRGLIRFSSPVWTSILDEISTQGSHDVSPTRRCDTRRFAIYSLAGTVGRKIKNFTKKNNFKPNTMFCPSAKSSITGFTTSSVILQKFEKCLMKLDLMDYANSFEIIIICVIFLILRQLCINICYQHKDLCKTSIKCFNCYFKAYKI